MNYRELGLTGLKVSEISMGCEGMTITRDIKSARPPTMKDTGKLSAINSFTVIPSYLYEGPKSKRRMLRR